MLPVGTIDAPIKCLTLALKRHSALPCYVFFVWKFPSFQPMMKTAVCATANNGFLFHKPRLEINRPIISSSFPLSQDKH